MSLSLFICLLRAMLFRNSMNHAATPNFYISIPSAADLNVKLLMLTCAVRLMIFEVLDFLHFKKTQAEDLTKNYG